MDTQFAVLTPYGPNPLWLAVDELDWDHPRPARIRD